MSASVVTSFTRRWRDGACRHRTWFSSAAGYARRKRPALSPPLFPYAPARELPQLRPGASVAGLSPLLPLCGIRLSMRCWYHTNRWCRSLVDYLLGENWPGSHCHRAFATLDMAVAARPCASVCFWAAPPPEYEVGTWGRAGVAMDWEINGLRLAGLSWGDTRRPTVLALHGWLDNAASFSVLAPLRVQHHVISIDLTGHGRSACQSADAGYQIWDDLPELLGVLDAWAGTGLP